MIMLRSFVLGPVIVLMTVGAILIICAPVIGVLGLGVAALRWWIQVEVAN